VHRPITKYETKARHAGSEVTELVWVRRPVSLTDIERYRRSRINEKPEPPPRPTSPPILPAVQRVLLVWDAPNLDMGLGSILGGRPTAAHRPALRRAGPLAAHPHRRTFGRPPRTSLEPEATVFTNIAPAAPTWSGRGSRPCATSDSRSSPNRRWTRTATSTRHAGHIALRRSEGLAAVVVASADGQAFRQPLEDIARDDGTPVPCSDFANMPAGR
jgi:uncharacterized protein